MQKSVFLAVLFAVLAGCGGGSDDTTGANNGGGTGGGNNADPLQQYINVNTQYSGIKTAANLDRVAASRFMSAITTLQPELLPNYDDQQASSAELCTDGGSAVLTRNPSNTEIAVRFTSCSDGGGILNGDATFRVVRRNELGDVVEGLMIYKDTLLSHNATQFVLRGSIRQKDISNSCAAEQNLSNVLLSVRDTNEQWYFENFYDQRFGAFGLGCMHEGMQFQGRVYVSDLGYVNVTTPELLKLPTMVYGLDRQGRLALTGANNQVFSWQFKNSASSNKPLYTHHFSLTGENAFSYQYPASIFNNQMMTDFRDTDGDGLSDVWELRYGFDSQNPEDALVDPDGDGFSNLQEFTYLGDPKDPASLPLIYQLSVSLHHTPGRQRDLISVSTEINHTFGADAYASELLYKTELPFQFSELNPECNLTADRLEARCKADYIQANTIFERSLWLEASSSLIAEIRAPISVTLRTIGLNTSSQTTATTMLSRNAADFNFNLIQAYRDTGTLIGVVGEQSSITLRLNQDGFHDFVPGLTINVAMPEELGGSEAFCRQGVDWQPCADFRILYSATMTEIQVTFTPNETGIANAKIQIMAPENSGPVAEWPFLVIAGQPASLLQQQIDSTTDSIIMVPADIFIGGLDLTAKKITLEGAGQETYLLGKIDDGDYSLRQLRMDKGSEIRGFSLANLQITTGSGGALFTSNIMGMPEMLQPGNDILAQGSLTLSKNRFSTAMFSHAFLAMSSHSSCSQLRLQQNDSATPYYFVYENNLYVNNGLQADYCSPIYLEGGYISRIEHNTLSDLNGFIFMQPATETKVFRLLARNNVLVKVSTAFTLNFDTQYFDSPPDLKVDVLNNLFDQVIYPIRGGNVPYTLKGNLTTSAGLNSFGIPLAGSAVIDAAASSDVVDDVFGRARPVDGNGDGKALPDIGAVEQRD